MKSAFKWVNLTVATSVLSLALAGPSFAAPGPDFTDLGNIPGKDKIISLHQNGIISGMAPGLFAPNEPLTEAQSIQFLVSAFGLNLDAVRFVKEPKATDYFTNADDKAWYAVAFITASVHNLDLPNSLIPDQSVTREEFTYRLIRAMENIGHLPMINPVVVKVEDEDEMNVMYSGAVQRALSYGIVKLNSDGTFNPKEMMTREQAAEEIFNAIEYLKVHSNASAPEFITASEGVKLITDLLGKEGTDIQIKINPDAEMTRESFVSLLMQTLKTSGKLPTIKPVVIEIADLDKVDSSNMGFVQLAVSLGVVKLSNDQLFHPKGELTHTEAKEIIANVQAVLEKFPSK